MELSLLHIQVFVLTASQTFNSHPLNSASQACGWSLWSS